MTDPPLSPAVAWLEEVYAAAVAANAEDPLRDDRDHAQAHRLAEAARADTTGRIYHPTKNGDDQ
ncbi:MAG: hypothetical protein DIU79_00215 [Actinobacteria bacterium]|nr:hypothetical protein [Thermoanaerobacterales bacterium]PZM98440.1 MAG: hypothetical protein DIU79_00215 [Actinomycetota bacterium]